MSPLKPPFLSCESIAVFSLLAIVSHLILRFWLLTSPLVFFLPLALTFIFGGIPLILDLWKKLIKRQFDADLLAGISIISSVLLGEYLAGSLVVLMLSSGEALENYAMKSSSSVLRALAKRMPQIGHRRAGQQIVDVPIEELQVEDQIEVFPHEVCPVDGTVLAGYGAMDESYLSGEPFLIDKAPGSPVLSGALNSASSLTIIATKLPQDSRYAQIVKVLEASEKNRPQLRRLADELGALYTPLALGLALTAWFVSKEPLRFLSVLVVATPCPLLIAIPIVIIGSISLSAKRGIVIKDPALLEQIASCETIILDKTGTLTHAKPTLTEVISISSFSRQEVLRLTASLERFSKHPLSQPIIQAARKEQLELGEPTSVTEQPGRGMSGVVSGHEVQITSRKIFSSHNQEEARLLPQVTHGLECIVVIDRHIGALLRFRDEPRKESFAFVQHLAPQHRFNKIMLVSGDRQEEVQYLADQLSITEVYSGKSPEEKVAIVVEETKHAKTLFLGDGINDAPALMCATVGIAFGGQSDITTEAAQAVIMEPSLKKVDELFHIGRRMRRIALESAGGGMALSVIAMVFALLGYLPPVAGALVQEGIDLFSVLNALRASLLPEELSDL